MRALLSVYDKTGIVEFARGLIDLGWELVSTGGTYSTLVEAGVPVLAVADVTGFPEILDGRVKTLHPVIHGGLLARNDNPADRAQLEKHDIAPIGLLAGNLYPFEQTVQREEPDHEDIIENIDIGGPAMIRAAAKNYRYVLPVTDPADYGSVLDALARGGADEPFRRELAAKAFAHTSGYDSLVAAYLRQTHDGHWPGQLTVAGRKVLDLRYGENPHQSAAAYEAISLERDRTGLLQAKQLQGKELSYNNLLDGDAAWNAVQHWSDPAVAIVKHTIPCGLAVRGQVADAFDAALEGDPVSAFGGIVAANRTIDGQTAEMMRSVFFEIILAPAFSPEAIEVFGKKKQLRLLQMEGIDESLVGLDVRSIRGGLLVQSHDDAEADDPSSWRVVTRREPTPSELADLAFAWRAAALVKSNAIVLARDQAVVGVGSGQPNRLESVGIAVRKAGARVVDSVLASDAFFPFADGIEAAVSAGVAAIVQPGGSIRDDEVIEAANAAGVAMVLTGRRHFRH